MTVDELKQQLIDIVGRPRLPTTPLPQDRCSSARAAPRAKSQLGLLSRRSAASSVWVLTEWQALMRSCRRSRAHAATVKGYRAQVAVDGKRFVAADAFRERLRHHPRYLKAAALRLDASRQRPARMDSRLMRSTHRCGRTTSAAPGNSPKGVVDPGAVPLAAGGTACRCSRRN